MPVEIDEGLLDRIARHFRLFGEREAYSDSPLYARLCADIAADRELLSIAARAWPRRPVPNLLFAAVHYLLLSGIEYRLSRYYPSTVESALPPDGAYPAFRDFCLEHREAIEQLITTRLVQTNEVRRSACLLPAFGIIAREVSSEPLALVEIGASAGLNLLWDRYAYDYGEGWRCGAPDAPMQLVCEARGSLRPPIPDAMPAVAYRTGIDINPVDVCDADAVRWLRALIWPEQRERARALERAVALARRDPPVVIAGDALELLPRVLARMPETLALCVYHSLVVNQLTPEARQRLTDMFADCARERALSVVSIEYRRDPQRIQLELDVYRNGVPTSRALASCHWHGQWIEWLDAETAGE